MNIFSLVILAVLWGASLFLKRRSSVNLLKIYKYVFIGMIILVFIFSLWQTRSQFFLWLNNSPSSFLLPPYNSINYFLFYSFYNFFIEPLIALIVALIFIWVANFFNKKFGERFFEKEEPYFGAIGIFLTGYPIFLLYIVAILISILIGAIVTRKRFSAYYLWLPVAIFVIIINMIWLKDLSLWKILKI
jgi:hypothetical protein